MKRKLSHFPSTPFVWCPLLCRPLLALVLCLSPVLAHAGLTFTTNNGTITITGYNGYAGGYLIIPDTINGWPVTTIGPGAFGGRPDVNDVLISTNVTSIGYMAFHICSLTNVTIPNSVTNIGDYAFEGCALPNIMIPNSVISIGTGSLGGGFYWEAITVDERNPVYSSTNGVLFNKNQTTLLQCPGGKSGSYTMPDTVASIGDWAFERCHNLTNLVLANSVTNIGVSAFTICGVTNITIPPNVINIEVGAFADCTSLNGLYFAGNAPTVGPYAFAGSTT